MNNYLSKTENAAWVIIGAIMVVVLFQAATLGY